METIPAKLTHALSVLLFLAGAITTAGAETLDDLAARGEAGTGDVFQLPLKPKVQVQATALAQDRPLLAMLTDVNWNTRE